MNKPVNLSNPADISSLDRPVVKDDAEFAGLAHGQRGSAPKAPEKSWGTSGMADGWDQNAPPVPVLRYTRGQSTWNTEETRGEGDKSGGADENTGDPATGKAPDRTLFASPQDEAKDRVAIAQKETDPEKALDALNNLYAHASTADVKKAMLADPGAQKLLQAAAKHVNQDFQKQPGPDAAKRGVGRLASMMNSINRVPQKLAPELAGALGEKVFQGHEKDYRAIQMGRSGADPMDTQALNDLLKGASGTVQGKQAVERLAGPETPAEAKARTSLEAKFKSAPAALAEFRTLTLDYDFQTLDPGARLALLSQISNYPKIEVVKNLHLLAGMPSFRNAEPMNQNSPSLDNQQRSAKIIAYCSQYTGGDQTIRDDTLRGLLTAGGKQPAFGWDNLPSKIHGQTSVANNQITINTNMVPAGNDPIKDPKVGANAVEVVAHEYNHFVNRGDVNGGFREFMGEYRAFLVGQRAATGKWPSQDEIYVAMAELVSPGGGYDRISKTYWDEKSPEGRKMREFMATMVGADPKTAKPDSYMSVDRNKLSQQNPPALPANLRPVKVVPGDPNNLDNH